MPWSTNKVKIAVVIPSYKVRRHIAGVIDTISSEVSAIYVVDDCCPEGTGRYVLDNIKDPRIQVLFNEHNQGVGGATIRGYRQALKDAMDIIVKIDGDGQMNPALMFNFIKPIITGVADYSKGNRFFNVHDAIKMPRVRIAGNAILSFVTKISSGYWNIIDFTNGYTAIHAKVLQKIPLNKISKRFFFESDMLCKLGIIRAVVIDVPMEAVYGDEESNLRLKNIIWPFLKGHSINFFKRILYCYFIRDFSIASVEMVLGFLLLCFGVSFGIWNWTDSIQTGEVASSGTVMLAALPVIVGTQLLLSALNYDIQNVPTITRSFFEHPLD